MDSSPAAEEELIPSLPNDLAVNILARVPRSDHPTLSLVSKPIKSLLSSPLFFNTRTLVSSTQHHIYLFLCHPLHPLSLFSFTLNDNDHKHKHRYSLLRVPPFPSPSLSPSVGFAYVSLGPTIFFLGGSLRYVPTPQVWTFDCCFNKWEPAPPMQVARQYPAAGVIDNKIYVFGGCCDDSNTWAEVFDPVIGKWEAIPSPIEIRDLIYDSAIVDNKLYATWDRGGIVYDPKNKVWERMESELKRCWSRGGCVVDGILYNYCEDMGNIQGFDLKEKVWKEIKGLDIDLVWAKMVNVGEKLVVVWEKRRSLDRNGNWIGKDAEIWCAEIEVEKKRDIGELWGKIGWVDKVWTMPNYCSSYLCQGLGVIL